MIWKGKALVTIQEIMSLGIDKCDSPAEAKEFMNLYRAENPHADSNVGYLSGYYSPEKLERIQLWFEVSHPIFGRGPVDPEVAFAKGLALGRKAREEK